MPIKTIDECIGDTPLVRLRRINTTSHTIAVKLEGNNPAGSVKDRPAFEMIRMAALRGKIKPGDTLIEATSGNTGIALAMAAAILGYKIIVIMPDHMSQERQLAMKAYGAQLMLTPAAAGMEGSIDLARKLESENRGIILDQFSNPDNPAAHQRGTGPEIWRDSEGRVTHFVSSTGTTGTIMGTGRYLKAQNPSIQVIGVRPDSDGGIPGIRAWPEEYSPAIFIPEELDNVIEVSKQDAVATTKRLAREEGIFAGISSGGNVWAALELARRLEESGQREKLIVSIICDRGDRYLSTGIFD